MKNHETVRPMTDGQRADLVKTFCESMPGASFDDADAILANRGSFVADLRSVFEKYAPSSLANRQFATWQKIYRDHFVTELGPVAIPSHRKGFDRLIVVAQGLTIQWAFNVCTQLFPSWKSSDDLDRAIPTNDREPATGSYAIWVRDRIEADEELKNLSANDLTARGVKVETVSERELHEIVYFSETGKHLDLGNMTLLAGSRSTNGNVPNANWNDDKFYVNVHWYGPDGASGGLRARQVVS